MKSRLFSRCRNWASGSSAALLAAAVALLGVIGPPPARAETPDWLRQAARQTLPDYPSDTPAVLLYDEQITTVKDKGEIKTRQRRAYKILRPDGREQGTAAVYFDDETKLTYLKGWGLPAGQQDYEVKEKDAVETQPYSGALYGDTHIKILRIPAAEPGNVVGYEYEQKARPFVLEDQWLIGREIPVRKTRYVLELPPGWEFDTFWLNHDEIEPTRSGENTWTWEVENVPAVKDEPAMPAWRSLAARMEMTLYPGGRANTSAVSHGSWKAVGSWYAGLAAPRRVATPDIKQKVAELTAEAPTLLDKIRAVARFAQRDIRYVAIEIGIGGYQPHLADDIFTNRYGDCKDKATLLGTMLGELGVDSYYVLVHTGRGVVAPSAPSAFSFNHAILAIRLPEDVPTQGLPAIREDDKLGRLLFFDPTDDLTPLGHLPPQLQGGYGLIADAEGGELMELPVLPPAMNRLLRVGKFVLTAGGDLTGSVKEIRWGAPARWRRAPLLRVPEPERPRVLENFLVDFLGGFVLDSSKVENLENVDENLAVEYHFIANRYAKKAGNLLLVRPRVLGDKSWGVLEGKEERHYPLEFDSTTLQSDVMEIMLPTGYAAEELPPPVHLSNDFVEYTSEVELEGNVLRYTRVYTVKDLVVPTDRLEEMKDFYRRVSADERNQAVFKRSFP